MKMWEAELHLKKEDMSRVLYGVRNLMFDNNVLGTSGDDYGAVYLPTDQARHHWETIEQIIEQVD